MVKDLKLEARGLQTIVPDVRMFAPQLDGRGITFWGAAERTAEELRPGSGADADAYLHFDKRIRAFASFLAYINVITPPDPKTPSLADAIMGLKLGKAFKDLGAKTGRETIRALPMAVADLVQETFEDEAIRGPLATRGVLYTAMGAWATGTAAVFINDSAGNDGGAAGHASSPRAAPAPSRTRSRPPPAATGWNAHGRRRHRRSARTNGRVVGVSTADGQQIDATHRGLGGRPQVDAASLRPRGARPAHGLAGGQHPSAGRHREGEPGALGAARLQRGGLRGASEGPHHRGALDRPRGEGDGRREVRSRGGGPADGGDDPLPGRPVARSRRQARDVDRAPGSPAPPARWRLDHGEGSASARSP